MLVLSKLLSNKENIKKIFPVALIAIALPIVVLLSLQQQNVRQKAASISCNDGLTCGTCTANSPTCSFGNGTQTCTYTSSLDGSSCNQVAIPNVFCHVNNCQAGAICNSSQVCVTQATPTPTNQKIVQFGPSGTPAQFQTLVSDASIDVIEMASGTYKNWRNVQINVDRTNRPLTIRPAAGATVTFDAAGDGNYGDAPFPINGGQYITFDATNGRFIFQHYLLAQVGIFTLINAGHITIKGVTVRNVAANAISNSESTHVIYVSHGNHDLEFDDFDIAAVSASSEPGGVYGLNGLQLYTGGSGAAIKNVTARNWKIDGANWATVVRNGSTGLVYDGWVVTNCGHDVDAAMDFGSDNTGIVSNIKVNASVGAPYIIGKMTDGGGNVWK